MDLRKILNDNKFAKRLNDSSVGRSFERNDFAISIEAPLDLYKDAIKKDSLIGLLFLACSPLLFPLCVSLGYTGLKVVKFFDKERYNTEIFRARESFVYTK